ncbi:hypothetical protein ABIF13_009292 [Bradyrhizobium elkanii]
MWESPPRMGPLHLIAHLECYLRKLAAVAPSVDCIHVSSESREAA